MRLAGMACFLNRDRPRTALTRVAFAGALAGITGITIAIVMIAAAATEGADADPVVSRAVTSAAAGPTSSPQWALP